MRISDGASASGQNWGVTFGQGTLPVLFLHRCYGDGPNRSVTLSMTRTLYSARPKPRHLGFFSPTGGTTGMRVGVRDASAIRKAAKKRGVTCAEVIQARDW